MMLIITLVGALALAASSTDAGEFAPTAKTSYGSVVGKIIQPLYDSVRQIYAFMGIPYAAPPVGDLRWKKPQPPKPFDHILNATYYRSACVQAGEFQANSSEDCLYLNVFTPNLDSAARLPVGVWIHGGDFVEGSAMAVNPAGAAGNFAARDTVLVTLNYRLGPFGFLSESSGNTVPPNLGVWDIVMALKWIQSEIANFGGDPNRVTIFGYGAGSVLCDLLQLSPVSNNLFQQIILMSGTVGNLPTVQESLSIQASAELAVKLGCIQSLDEWTPQNLDRIMACFKQKSSEEIQNAASSLDKQKTWIPSIDGPTGIITEHPEILRKRRKPTPALIGQSKGSTIIDQTPDKITPSYVLQNITKLLYDQYYDGKFYDKLYPLLESLINMIYLNPSTAGQSSDQTVWYDKTLQLCSDAAYGQQTYPAAMSMSAAGSPVFMYQFDYLPESLRQSAQSGSTNGWPVGLDVQLLFGAAPVASRDGLTYAYNASGGDLQMYDTMGQMWTNFMKNGQPGVSGQPQWNPATYDAASQTFKTVCFTINDSPGVATRSTAEDLWGKIIPQLLQLVACTC